MKKKVVIPLVVAGLALIAIPFLVRKSNASSAVQYQTSTVAAGTLTSTITGSGNLYVDSTASISPTISGTVKNLKVKLGDAVTKGQVLFTIDDSGQLDATVTKASSSITQAKQSLENAKTQLLQAQQDVTTANTRNTEKAGTVSDAELAIISQKVVAAQASVEVATNGVTTAQSDYSLAKTNAAKRTVTSPIDGTVTSLTIANGDTVGSSSGSSATGSMAAVVIDNLNTLKAKVSLNEVDAIAAAVGQKASLTFDAISDLTLTGKIESVSVTGTVSNGVVSYEAIIGLDAQSASLRPQMTTTATITTNVKQNVISVPTTAIKTSNNVSYVQVMENKTPRQQEVTLGISSDTNTEITAGLSVGQTIVTSTVSSTSTTSSSNSSNKEGGVAGMGATRVMGGVPGMF